MDQNLVRVCAHCGVDISHKHSRAVCCSQACNRKRHYQLNKEATLTANKKWRVSNRERANAIQAAYRARMDGDRLAERRRYAVENKKAWRQANPELAREESRCQIQAYRAKVKGVPGRVTRVEMAERLALFDGCCAYCGAEGRQSLDHFIPMAAGGKHMASNLVPACLACNRSKKDTEALAWFQQQDFFSEQRWQKILTHTS
jgi:5-methylcytosine-specific restriction endonuclease McrA